MRSATRTSSRGMEARSFSNSAMSFAAINSHACFVSSGLSPSGSSSASRICSAMLGRRFSSAVTQLQLCRRASRAWARRSTKISWSLSSGKEYRFGSSPSIFVSTPSFAQISCASIHSSGVASRPRSPENSSCHFPSRNTRASSPGSRNIPVARTVDHHVLPPASPSFRLCGFGALPALASNNANAPASRWPKSTDKEQNDSALSHHGRDLAFSAHVDGQRSQ